MYTNGKGIGQGDKPSGIGHGDKWIAGPLLTPADFSILTVNVDPNEPPDFVVAIKGGR
jgi:hypothetical protein